MKSFSTYFNELYKPKGLDKFRKNVSGVDQVDTRDQAWHNVLPSEFAKYGFKKLGSGKYASVFGHSKYPYVVKVFMKDAAYLKWIEFCQSNRDNKYVPKIRGKVTKINKMFMMIRLEKLTPYSSGKSASEFNASFAKWKSTGEMPEDQDLVDVFTYFAKYKKLLDLHGENMMMRGNQIVVIDPFYNWYGKTGPGYSIDPDDINPNIF